MIKTNELRVGNHIANRNGFEMVIHSIFKDDTVYLDFIPPLINDGDVWEEDFKDISPIILTEEYALKFGFKKINSENNKTYLSPQVDGMRMKIYFNRFGVAKFAMNMFHQIEIENVHTLQNLFFALTGSELIFSTEP